jgi:hypothetical protein
VENPSCYLYNAGINKLRLTAKNEDGCSHSISAGNLYVNNVALAEDRKYSTFFSEEEELPFITPSQGFISAYPTLITDEVEYLNVKSNEEKVLYSIYDTYGNVILTGENSSSFRIKLPYMQKGIYVLEVNGKYIKLIRL